MILSFRDGATEEFWRDGTGRRLPGDLKRVAMRKLMQVDGAGSLEDLKVPPGNRLELLKADRAGQHSVRINDRYRICFRWENGNAYDVEIVDYH